MKEIIQFETWANDLVAESFNQLSRPLPLSKDIQHQANVAHPDLPPEQALILFLADKIDQSDKVDIQQNKNIANMDREVDQVDAELDGVEQDERDIHLELDRIKQLLGK